MLEEAYVSEAMRRRFPRSPKGNFSQFRDTTGSSPWEAGYAGANSGSYEIRELPLGNAPLAAPWSGDWPVAMRGRPAAPLPDPEAFTSYLLLRTDKEAQPHP